jgi:hypothetical protein
MRPLQLRQEYHQNICKHLIRIRQDRGKEYPNFADSGNSASIKIAWKIAKQINYDTNYSAIASQTSGDIFEIQTKAFLEKSFELLQHLRPGKWTYSVKAGITDFEQSAHLANLQKIVNENKELSSALGIDYIVKSDNYHWQATGDRSGSQSLS